MPRVLAPLAIFVALSGVVNAGIQITKPASGIVAKAGSALEVEWKEGGTGPALADLDTFTVDLCAGSNDDPVCGLAVIAASQKFSTLGHAEGVVQTSVGEDKPTNAYFVRLIAVAKTGGQLTTYSPRFSYSGMKGTFAATVKTSLDKLKSTETSGPPTKDETDSGKKPAAGDASDFEVNYTMQTGPTRYAPMQPIPGTKITKTGKPTPLFPTSAVSFAKSHLPIPTIATTVTQSQTHKVESRPHTEPPAPNPSDDMAKFLARWRD
ncbi:unnamed protein product [Periconia digitata]|uniref:Uncharacterized protein n=1 Tax=Periconia digitata TaxID=1303443 RepID=A0A9W4XMB1_9PLEO|nr:unnamed protein product [Periconia digitata]